MNKTKYKKDIETINFQGKTITLESLSPIMTPEQETAYRNELEQQLYEVFKKYAKAHK